MRRTKVVLVLDVGIEEDFCIQDMVDCYKQALDTVNETFIHKTVLYEHEPKEETFNELLDNIKIDFQYGDCRDWC